MIFDKNFKIQKRMKGLKKQKIFANKGILTKYCQTVNNKCQSKKKRFSKLTCSHNLSGGIRADTSEPSGLRMIVPSHLSSGPRVPDDDGAVQRGGDDVVLAGEGDGVDGVGMAEEWRDVLLNPT